MNMQMVSDRVISPARGELEKLRQPLRRSEQMVLEVFDRNLDPAWEIYIKPHLNGLRPDFVLLNPGVGIGVFDVKDWDLDELEYSVEDAGYPELIGQEDGKRFSLQAQNPVLRAEFYRNAIYQLYCPRLQASKGLGAITAGVIFPFADSRRVKSLLARFLEKNQTEAYGKYLPISGLEEVAEQRTDLIFPESKRKSSGLMSEELAEDLREWLVEPDFSKAQRRPLEMDSTQRNLSENRTDSGYRRIRGAAGSGKSLVLAARAARLAEEGKSVLVATYNITLWHYLRDLVSRAASSAESHQNIVYQNFHSWCADVCGRVGWTKRYNDLWKGASIETVVAHSLPALVATAHDQEGAPRYDAILVDEGQDYSPLWWNTLQKFLKPGGEMVLVADATQDIYGTAGAWTDEVMNGAGFRGAWVQLERNYRLPPSALPLISEFADRFLSGEGIDLPVPAQGSLDLYPASFRWVQCHDDDAADICVSELTQLLRFTGNSAFANADLTFLASDVASGSTVVDMLEKNGLECVSTFAKDTQERRREKMGFYMGDARVKATTLHSFKGWESSLLLVQINGSASVQSMALVYAALTRLKRHEHGSHLVVVCSDEGLASYGETWPDFENANPKRKTAPEAATIPLRHFVPLNDQM